MLDKINANMSIGARLALVSGLFAAASLVVATFFVLGAQSQIEFSAKESDGTVYLMQAWEQIQNDGDLSPRDDAEAFDAGEALDAFNAADTHDAKIETGVALFSAVADGSNLTLDPELDSFYAMDAVTVRIPAVLKAAAASISRRAAWRTWKCAAA